MKIDKNLYPVSTRVLIIREHFKSFKEIFKIPCFEILGRSLKNLSCEPDSRRERFVPF